MDCPKRRAVAGLPDDAVVEVLSRLPAKSLCRSKCVSNAWCDLIADRLRCTKLPQTLEGFFYCCANGCHREDCSSDEDGDGISNDGDSGSEEDGHESASEGGGNAKNLLCCTRLQYINLLGISVPLVDPSFSFLTAMPRIRKLTLVDSCSGLLLFSALGFSGVSYYIVCNPATEHWAVVPCPSFGPSSGFRLDFTSTASLMGLLFPSSFWERVSTYLIFDPFISPHFQLIEICHCSGIAGVHTYSSETGLWVNSSRDWGKWQMQREGDLLETILSRRGSTVVNKMLRLIISPLLTGPELIVAVDGNGEACRTIRWLEKHGFPVFLGKSRGLLHCVSVSGHQDGNSCYMSELSVWALEDYEAAEWNLKHTVSFLELFGKETCRFGSDYHVATIHPERNLVFFVQHWDYKLVSYDMDRKEVCALRDVGCDYGKITPYVPYFSESVVLKKK
ncbi:hypothetical protein BS78_02G061100 [Paspalum vaginatum]|nr:hypothetical protein BS78_02G061100 [Paspalum vaginatum]